MSATRPALKLSVRTLSRVFSVLMIIASGSVLAIAAWLDPATEAGQGTHTQLGLGECTVLQLTGWPCPMCGMTTTFSLMAHLQPLQALWNQPFGVVLFASTAAVFAIGLIELIQPRDRWRRIWARMLAVEGWLAVLFLGGLGLSWAWKIALMRGWLG